jgi:hypothetical protein
MIARACCTCCDRNSEMQLTIAGVNASMCSCLVREGAGVIQKLDSIAIDGTYLLAYSGTFLQTGKRHCVYVFNDNVSVSAVIRSATPDGFGGCTATGAPFNVTTTQAQVIWNLTDRRVVSVSVFTFIAAFAWAGSDVVGAVFSNQVGPCLFSYFSPAVASGGTATLSWA